MLLQYSEMFAVMMKAKLDSDSKMNIYILNRNVLTNCLSYKNLNDENHELSSDSGVTDHNGGVWSSRYHDGLWGLGNTGGCVHRELSRRHRHHHTVGANRDHLLKFITVQKLPSCALRTCKIISEVQNEKNLGLHESGQKVMPTDHSFETKLHF